jgi:carboxyl-terminal processing protease
LALFGNAVAGVPDKEPFNFQEVYELLKTHLAGATEAELNQAAALGLLEQLASKVSIVGEPARGGTDSGINAPVTSSLFDRHYGYIRINRLGGDVGSDFRAAFDQLQATNVLKGLVLDLRYTGGQDYAAAVALADCFFSTVEPLVDWGEGWRSSTSKTNAITLPVALLVNRRTTGAAEALAGILRYREIGLVIGTNTAGQASMAREFTLKSGQRLRLAIAPVKVADGRELPFTGIKPDIAVEVSPEDELAWYDDAYKVVARSVRSGDSVTNELAAASTNRPPRRRMNEAELVRMNREGQSVDREFPFTNAPGRTFEPPVPVVNDPALVRALDLLKGLAVVQQFRSL